MSDDDRKHKAVRKQKEISHNTYTRAYISRIIGETYLARAILTCDNPESARVSTLANFWGNEMITK